MSCLSLLEVLIQESVLFFNLYVYVFFEQFSLLFAQGQLLQALRLQDFQKEWGGGEPSSLPGAACPILLPAGDGRVEKVYPCTIKCTLASSI